MTQIERGRKGMDTVSLFGCPIITQEPLDRLALNFDWGTLSFMDRLVNEKLQALCSKARN